MGGAPHILKASKWERHDSQQLFLGLTPWEKGRKGHSRKLE